MTKKQLKKEILSEVEKHLEQNILEQFEKFQIVEISHNIIKIECCDKLNDCKNGCQFNFNWFN